MIQRDVIAIDIGKSELRVQTAERGFTVKNAAPGWRRILDEATKYPHPLVVCEASGGYERELLTAVSQAGVPFRLVNAARVRHFAGSDGLKAKTDPLDGKLIFRFASEKKLQPALAPSPEQQRFADLLDRRGQLTTLLAREKNHLEHTPKELASSCKRIMRTLEREIEKLEELIREHVTKNPLLAAQYEILTAVQGVGEVTAWSLLAYLPEITSLSRNQLVALVGVAPFNDDSGSIRGKRRISGGRSKVRRCLYMAAQTAANHNAVISAYVRGLRERGKAYKCALVAAMRKLLIHLQSLLKKAKLPLAA